MFDESCEVVTSQKDGRELYRFYFFHISPMFPVTQFIDPYLEFYR